MHTPLTDPTQAYGKRKQVDTSTLSSNERTYYGLSNLEESTLLQQPGHLLIFPFARLPLQTEIPELIAIINTIRILVERLFQENEDSSHAGEIVRHGLPLFDVPYHLRSLLPLTEIDHVPGDLVLSAIVDERQRS